MTPKWFTLTGQLGVEVLPGSATEGGAPLVYFRLRHKRLPGGGVQFAMDPALAVGLSDRILAVATPELDGDGGAL